MLALGTLIAVLPETAFAFASARVPDAVGRDRLDDPAGDRHACSRAGAGRAPASSRSLAAASTGTEDHLHVRVIGVRAFHARKLPDASGLSRAYGAACGNQTLLKEGKDLDQTLAAFVEMRSGGSRCAGKHRLQRTGLVVALRAGFRRPGHDPADRSPLVSSQRRLLAAATRRSIPASTPVWTMSSKPRLSPRSPGRSPAIGIRLLQPWQLFTLAGLLGATITVFLSRGQSPAAVIILSLAVFAAAAVGIAALRTVMPLTSKARPDSTQVLGGRTRAVLERDKALVLRSIKELEFDRAMGKVSEKDFAEMSGRLRARAARLLRQLDAGAGYRADRTRDRTSAWKAPVVAGVCASCGTNNDADARFCKGCGKAMEARS